MCVSGGWLWAFVVGTRDYSLDRVYAFFQALACPRVCLVFDSLHDLWHLRHVPLWMVSSWGPEQQTFPHHFSKLPKQKPPHDHTPCVHSACPCAHCPGNGLPTATKSLVSLVEPGTPTIRFPLFLPFVASPATLLPAAAAVQGGITSETSGPPYWWSPSPQGFSSICQRFCH